ncbi:MAG: LacI family DNA-binding transcriptional regulator [Eubacteriales bacterium]|jgi:LacI family transcriptional regulator
MVSIKDVAREAGVSVSTVSRVIRENGYVAQEKKELVLETIKRLNYSPSAVARSLVSRQSKLVGMVISTVQSPFLTGLLAGCEEILKQNGYMISILHTHENPEIEAEAVRKLLSWRVDAIISCPSFNCPPSVYEAAAQQIPVVFVGRYLAVKNAHSIESDNVNGAKKAMDYLVELGHRRIILLNGPLCISTSVGRWCGVQQSIEENNLDRDQLIIRFCNNTVQGGYEAMMDIFRTVAPLPTAVYCDNNQLAAGVFKACEQAGILVPHRLSVAAYDGFDDTVLGDVIRPHVTANIHPSALMAEMAANMVLEACRDRESWKQSPRHTVLPLEFRVRESTAPPAQTF